MEFFTNLRLAAIASVGMWSCAEASGASAPGTEVVLLAAEATASWSRCDERFECGRLRVPLDYARPEAGEVELVLKRHRATGQRVGSLLVNPGGPGASAVSYLPAFVDSSPVLREAFDLVAFDPRGVGQSAPLDCHENMARWLALDPSPDDDAEWAALTKVSADLGRECGEKHAALLPQLGTLSVARDLERVRAALGDEPLNYLGLSYGGAIGAAYAGLYPTAVRSMVLDGATDWTLPALDYTLAQAVAFEQALNRYLAWCDAARGRCAWTGGRPAAGQLAAIAAQLERAPLRSSAGGRAAGSGELFRSLLYTAYYGQEQFGLLTLALELATEGEGSALLRMTDSYYERRADGSYPNSFEVNSAVNCLDRRAPGPAELRQAADRFARAAPFFGVPLLAQLLICAQWPAAQPATAQVQVSGVRPALFVGTTGDPASPYAWSRSLSARLVGSVLLTYENNVHLGYRRGSPCIDDAVHAYLTTLRLPPAGTRCR